MRTPAASALAAVIRALTAPTVRWLGWIPDPRPRVYFANHTSHLDFPVLWSALPPEVRAITRPVAARDYWGGGGLRQRLLTGLFDALLIERGCDDAAGREAQIELLARALDGGASLILFPEGTRRPGPEPGPFKSGLYHLARRRPGLELVPVYLSNLSRMLPKGETFPVPLLSAVTGGLPVRLEPGEPKEIFLERARQAVSRLRVAA